MNDNVMTLGVFAHANAGKTTITEQLLYHTNVKKSAGRVDYGTTTTDSMKVEQDRGITVRSSMVTLPLRDRKVQLIDTPGHIDFSAEVERAISVLDGAILVVSGVEGVESQTQVIWKILQERKVPTVIFVNKLDRAGSDYGRVVRELQSKLSVNIVPIVNVSKDENDGTLSFEDIKVENIIEELADLDDNILSKYVENEKISREWLEQQVQKLSKHGGLHFVYGGSALNDEGMYRLIDGISKYLPVSKKNVDKDFSGYVYTVKRDSGARELYLKVISGELQNRQEFINELGIRERIRTLYTLDGTKRIRRDSIGPGEIGIVTGISSKCGDIIGKSTEKFNAPSFINPLFHTTVSLQDNNKLPELVIALETLNDEDPNLNLQFDKETKQISVDLMGPLQTEIIDNLLVERFGLKAQFSDPIIIHKETPIGIGQGAATFDRVSGVQFVIKPLSRGSGLRYSSKFSTDYLFPKYQKQIERLVNHYCKQGLYGWELTDCEINLIGGISDSVCSDPSHFNVIVPLALMRSIKQAGTQLLEPIMNYEVTTPNTCCRKMLSSLSNYGILYDQIVDNNEFTIIPGKSYLSDVIDLPNIVTRISGGHGSVIRKPDGYEIKPNSDIVTKNYIGPDPRNEQAFAIQMNSSVDHVDRIKKR